jgi:hypothetical protein
MAVSDLFIPIHYAACRKRTIPIELSYPLYRSFVLLFPLTIYQNKQGGSLHPEDAS